MTQVCGVRRAALREDVHQFSINLKQGEITNQKSSGRCWMFAALNTMRFAIIKKLNLETYELSQNYPLFWDKLEKSNYFQENILATLDEPTGGPADSVAAVGAAGRRRCSGTCSARWSTSMA